MPCGRTTRAAHHLVGVPRIDTEAHGHLDRLVELRERVLLGELDRLAELVTARLDLGRAAAV